MYRILSAVVSITAFVTFSHADMHDAVDSLLLKIEKNPDSYKLHYDLGLCYGALDEYEKALDAFTRSYELKRDFGSARYKMAVVYYEMDSLEAARSIFEELKRKYVDDKTRKDLLYTIYSWCGKLDALQKQYDEAIANYREALKFNDYPRYMENRLAQLYYRTGDTVQAVEYLKKSVDGLFVYYHSKQNAMLSSAIYHYYFKNYDEAVTIENSIYTDDTTNAIVQYNLGVFNIASGNGEGVELIAGAVNKDATGFIAAVYSAILAVSEDSFSVAESLLKQDIKALRVSGLAKGLLAWILEKLGKTDEARRLWLKCYCQLPLGTDVESMRSYISKFIETVRTYRRQP